MSLDKPQRQELEKVVTKMRNRIEEDINYQVNQIYSLKDKDEIPAGLGEEQLRIRERLVEAVEREAIDSHSWERAIELYIRGTGYTIVNRLAALRCMEVRGLAVPNFNHGDRAVTQLREDGRTPASDPLIQDFEVASREEGILEAYRRACEGMEEEIEILFDSESPYNILNPDFSAFEELLRVMDEVDVEIWAADDVLGWVYEYYNAEELERIDRNSLDVDEVSLANQFYTPHWVVRMLADNSLGKLYQEYSGGLDATLQAQQQLTSEERMNHSSNPGESPGIEELCTYLVPSESGNPTNFDDPSDIRIIDPACGSGHFLLYAFDILERIWWAEKPDIPRQEIPNQILKHNLHGVDLDLRACQLAAFNLYLKARSRTIEEGGADFTMPPVGIVCADARVADLDSTDEVFDEVAGENEELREVLDTILGAFQDVHGLGSLLDAKGTLSQFFEPGQKTLADFLNGHRTLPEFLRALREAIGNRKTGESFLAQDLRSFLRLLLVLSEDYDVALMNPPYGSRGRMPGPIKKYVKDHYQYSTEFYITFFEVCERLVKSEGRIGMLVPRSFMFKDTYREFREDFIGPRGSFEFLAETGKGVLDNATVRTAVTVVRKTEGSSTQEEGLFYRLHDHENEPERKHTIFAEVLTGTGKVGGVQRQYRKKLEEFSLIPGSNLSYWVPRQLRELYSADTVFDAENGRVEGRDSLGVAKVGLQTGKDDRYFRRFWETPNSYETWVPIAKGGEDAWMLPRVTLTVDWNKGGTDLKRFSGSYIRNEDQYFQEALTYTVAKEGGRRFGFLHSDSVFGHKGSVFIPTRATWHALAFANSDLSNYLMLCQTPERMWEIGEISKLPWDTSLEELSELDEASKRIAGLILSLRQYDLESPYYRGPALLDVVGVHDDLALHGPHPHRNLIDKLAVQSPDTTDTSVSVDELTRRYTKHQEQIIDSIVESAETIDETIFDHFEISNELRENIYTEIQLRQESGNDRERDIASEVLDDDETESRDLVKKLLLHLTFRIIEEDEDGIVLANSEGEGEEPALLAQIEELLLEIFGEHGHDRLEEIDRILRGGNRHEGRYPAIQTWLQESAIEEQLSELRNTPVFWKITTKRLVAEPGVEGFSCFVDFNQLDSGIFERIQARYLDNREMVLREKQNAANQRRNDSSLSAEDRAEAVEEYERCQDALRQIEEFKQVIRRLSRAKPRELDDEYQQLALDLAPKVAEFRERTEQRLTTLDKLAESASKSWFKQLFSDKFLDNVNEQREEWISALEDLEAACDAYARDPNEPVEAHHYDLFPYFDDLVGSTHYSSNGIFFMNYYFSKDQARQLLDQNGQPKKDLAESQRLLAELAAETDRDIELGKEINEACQTLAEAIPSDWEARALEEITCAGYQPNKKHGVRINIKPLTDAGIVPEIVEEKVL